LASLKKNDKNKDDENEDDENEDKLEKKEFGKFMQLRYNCRKWY